MLKPFLGPPVDMLCPQRRKPGGFTLRKHSGEEEAGPWLPSWKEESQSAGNSQIIKLKVSGVGSCKCWFWRKQISRARPLISPKKKDDLPRSEFGPWKIPCVYAFFFFFKQPKNRGKLIFLWGWGGGEGHYTAHKPSELNRIPACG